MRVNKFLHKLLGNTIHSKRISVLSEAVESALETKNLTLTGLGRGINNNCKERSNIRKMDRLLGNKKLEAEGEEIYQRTCRCLLHGTARPVLIVDAVKLPAEKTYALRASCSIGGRTHTIYEMLFQTNEKHSQVHKRFITALNRVLPEHCKPIVVTDAGFHNPWFKLILSQGWDYIGRVRGLKIYKHPDEEKYKRCSELWEKATSRAKFIFKAVLSRVNPLECYFYSIKNKLKGRATKETKDNALLHYARSIREPWLLATSLGEDFSPEQVIAMYKKRMKIEESFRDMKSTRYGLGLAQFGVKNPARLGNMLLIAMLANFIACCIGQVLEMKNKQYEFQANSIRNRRVLSYFYLGCQAFRKGFQISMADFKETWAIASREADLPLC